MPSYQYICQSCKGEVEISSPITEPVPEPSCCQSPMQRIWSAVGAVFKGTGWGSKP